MIDPLCGCGGALASLCGCDADDAGLCRAMAEEAAARDDEAALEVARAIDGLFGPFRLARRPRGGLDAETFDAVMRAIARAEGLLGVLAEYREDDDAAWHGLRQARGHIFAAALLVRSARVELGLDGEVAS